ncbi:MAG TPA: hypothetical protein VK459_27230 [Polyangiaceae bacterium]|nr:hypothetical protein [Polyangiaceae bacterium]
MKLSPLSLLAVVSLGCAPAALPAGSPIGAPSAHPTRLTSAELGQAAPSIDLLAKRPAPAQAGLAGSAQPSGPAFHFAHVLHEGGLRIVLTDSANEDWATGAAALISKESPVVARRPVAKSSLPLDLAAVQGRRVTLLKAGEIVCEAKVTGLSVLARVEPYFGMRAEWEGAGEEGKAPLTDPEIADEAWSLAGASGRALVADLEPVAGSSCAGATWARDATASPESMARASAPSASLERRALTAFRALPAYAELQELQRSFRDPAEPAPKGPWEEAEDAELTVSELKLRAGAGTWVWVSARSAGGCGEFHAELSALFEVRQGPFGPELVARYAGQEAPESAPEAVVDSHGDGRVEILFPAARLRSMSPESFALEELAVPSYDCPC